MPTLRQQAERLIELGVHQLAGLSESDLCAAVAPEAESERALLVIKADMVAASRLAPLLQLDGKPGFVVEDMADVDGFAPIAGVDLPGSPVYVVHDLDRGDDLANWSPNEALVEIAARGRTPLTLTEGMYWLLQRPDRLERNHCFMTIGSRLTEAERLARRTDARRFGSATAPAATAPPGGMRPRSAGAGPATGTPGSALPPRAAGPRWTLPAGRAAATAAVPVRQ